MSGRNVRTLLNLSVSENCILQHSQSIAFIARIINTILNNMCFVFLSLSTLGLLTVKNVVYLIGRHYFVIVPRT